MRYVRIFADADGESHFEDAELEGKPGQVTTESRTTLLSGPLPASALTFVEPLPDASTEHLGIDLPNPHTAPSRRWAIVLSGRIAVTASDGERREFGPGDVLLAEDTSGRGHWTTALVPDTRIMMVIAPESGEGPDNHV